MVLQFAQYLVNRQIFKRVQVVFLIMGHTKNICDCRFKDLKHRFHHRNIYTMEQLKTVLSQDNENYVKVIQVDHNDFYNWDSFLTNTIGYKKAIKDVSKFHCFFYDEKDNGILTKQKTIIENNMVKEKLRKEIVDSFWKQNSKTLMPRNEPKIGISDIKQVELFSKWRNLIPDQFRDCICPKPTQEVITKVKQQKALKARNKLKLKET